MKRRHQYSSAFGTRFLLWPGTDFNATQLSLGGRNTTAHDATYNGENIACRFDTRVCSQLIKKQTTQ